MRKFQEYQRDYYVLRARKLERQLQDVDQRLTVLAMRGNVARTFLGDSRDEVRELRERRSQIDLALRTCKQRIREGEMR